MTGVAVTVVGWRSVVAARRVLDRFNAADGGLLAAGVAYNAILALIPLGLLASGLAGLILTDPTSRAELILALARVLPPLAGVVDEIVVGLSRASPSLSLLGLVLAAWGTSRLFAALESALAQLDVTGPRRSLARRAARRVGSILALAAFLVAAVLAAPALAILAEVSGQAGSARPLLDVLSAIVPPALGGLTLAAVYRLIPARRATWAIIISPALVGTLAVLLVTRVFVFVTPRLFGANLVYGTLGATLVALTWLDLVFTIVLLGGAWVADRSSTLATD